MSTTQKKIKLPTMDFPFSIKQLNEDLGTFEGHCATWDIDLQKDRIPRGAFEKTLQQAKADLAKRDGEFIWPVCWQHNTNEPIGGIYEAYEDSKGLFVRGMLDLDTELGRRAFSALKKKYMDSFSIGYKPTRHHMEAARGIPGGIRVLDEIHLYEVSVVLFPANPEARVRGVKTAYDAWAESMLNDMKRVAARCSAQKVRNGMNDFNEAAFGGRTDRSPYSDTGASFRIVPGEDPMESREEFNKELRAELRASDPDLYNLVPGGRAYNNEIERRKQEREEKRRLEREALAADRKAIADARIEPLETYTVEQLAAKSGIDITWLTRFVQVCVAGGEVTPAVEGTLVLKGCDFMKLAKRHSAEFEAQFVSAARKRAERVAREKAAA